MDDSQSSGNHQLIGLHPEAGIRYSVLFAVFPQKVHHPKPISGWVNYNSWTTALCQDNQPFMQQEVHR